MLLPTTLDKIQRYAVTAINGETLTGFVRYKYTNEGGYLALSVYADVQSFLAIENIRDWNDPAQFNDQLKYIDLIGVVGNPMLIKPFGERLDKTTLREAKT